MVRTLNQYNHHLDLVDLEMHVQAVIIDHYKIEFRMDYRKINSLSFQHFDINELTFPHPLISIVPQNLERFYRNHR
jgi:hypothetical protein